MRHVVLALVAGQVLASTSGAFAADMPNQGNMATTGATVADMAGCQLVEANYCVPMAGAASVQKVTGNVSILRKTATSKVVSESLLTIGDRVVSQGGSAMIVLSQQCKINLGAFSSARILIAENMLCASVGGGTPVAATAAAASTGSAGNLVAGALALGAVGGAFALSGQQHGPVSP